MSEENAPAPVADNAPPPAPAVAPAPSPAPATSDWKAALPEDIRADPTLSKFTTQEGLAKSYINLEKMLGSDKVVVPKEGDQEGEAKFFKAAGWPDKPEEYGFKQPEKIPDGMVYNAELDQQLSGIFHGAKLTKAQAANTREKLLELVASGATQNIEAAKAQDAANQQAIIQGETALKAEWGQAYEQRGKIAGAAINKFLSPETVAALDAAGVANNPAIIKDMYTLGVKLAGEKELIGEGNAIASPADLDSHISTFREKNGAALFDRAHPEHVQRTKELTALFERRFPEQAA